MWLAPFQGRGFKSRQGASCLEEGAFEPSQHPQTQSWKEGADLPSGHRELISVSYSRSLCPRAGESGPPTSGPFRNMAALTGRPGMSAPGTEGCWFAHPLFRPTKSTPPAVPLGPDKRKCLHSPPQPLSRCPPGSRTVELFPDSPETCLQAPDPPLSAPPAKSQLLGSKEC